MADPSAAMPDPMEGAAETAAEPSEAGESLSMSLLGGKEAKPGDIIRIKVASINDADGTFTAEPADMEQEAAPVGINQMASAFDEKGMV
jgi:hypothetical protein